MIFSRLKRKNKWWRRHKHDDYFMSDEEWRFEEFYQHNKEQLDDLANMMSTVILQSGISIKELTL